MIIELPQHDLNTTDRLQHLLDVLPATHPKRNAIEADLRRSRSGDTGEKGVAYHLRFWYDKDDQVVALNNLRLEFGGRSAQIDHLVALPGSILVLESKALPDRVEIATNGDWFMVKGTKKTGIYNPAEQNKRHIAVLEDIARDLGVNPLPPIYSVIVLTKPEVIVEGTKPKGCYLVRLDKLNAFIDKGKGFKPKNGARPATELANQLIHYHKPLTIDVYARYGIGPNETKPVNERIQFDPESKTYKYAFCGNSMLLQKTRSGLFWGCSNYPQCKSPAPVAVAVEIGKAAAEAEYASKGFLAQLFSDRIRICPICGSALVWKDTRKGGDWVCPQSRMCGYKG